jgi:hypothetical protein
MVRPKRGNLELRRSLERQVKYDNGTHPRQLAHSKMEMDMELAAPAPPAAQAPPPVHGPAPAIQGHAHAAVPAVPLPANHDAAEVAGGEPGWKRVTRLCTIL